MKKKESWLDKKLEAIVKRSKKDRAYKKRMIVVWAMLLTIWTGAVFYLAQFVVISIAQWIIDVTNWDVNLVAAQTVCVAISNAVAVIVAVLVSKKLFKRIVTRDSLGLKGLPTWTDILLSPIGYIVSTIAAAFVIMILQAVMKNVDWSQAQDIGFNSVYSSADRIITFVALVIVAPVTEELIFRGFLYGRLRTKLSAVPAIILVSLLFGALHGQWNVGIVVGVMSIFMCIARELTGTIYAGILMHMIRNGIAFYFLYVNPIASVAASCVLAPTVLPFLI
ncbi:MAG: CPBP family intramembrane metalloprotease [Candidatus Saccharibacteria bacterium]|nr:CPBP family intramembrane metalloprotease [Candidatus Saccharibacteria bacterium]